jgi:hypothetical protein
MIFRLSEEILITKSFNRFLSSAFDESDFDHLRSQKARLELLSCTTMRTVTVLVRVQLPKTLSNFLFHANKNRTVAFGYKTEKLYKSECLSDRARNIIRS